MRAIAVTVALALAAACTDASDGAAVDVVEVDGAPHVHEPVRAGDALVAVDGAFGAAPAQVLTSTDAGTTWEPTALPGATGPVWRLAPRSLDGWATVVARDDVENRPAGAVYVWTTTDGRTWHGGRLGATAPSFVHADVHRFGDVLLASFTSERRLELHRSEDGGSTWDRAAALDLGIGDDQSAHLPLLWQEGDELVGVGDFRGANPPLEGFVLTSPDGGRTWPAARRCAALECPAPVSSAGDLLLRGDEVSSDGGATWARAEVEPRDGILDLTGLTFDTVVRHGDGWLATASLYVPSDVEHGFLLASDDGRSWRHVAEDPCLDDGGTRPNSRFRGPVIIEDVAYVTYSCIALIDAVSGVVLRIAPGEDAEPVEGTEVESRTLGAPHHIGDLLVVPVQSSEDTDVLQISLR